MNDCIAINAKQIVVGFFCEEGKARAEFRSMKAASVEH